MVVKSDSFVFLRTSIIDKILGSDFKTEDVLNQAIHSTFGTKATLGSDVQPGVQVPPNVVNLCSMSPDASEDASPHKPATFDGEQDTMETGVGDLDKKIAAIDLNPDQTLGIGTDAANVADKDLILSSNDMIQASTDKQEQGASSLDRQSAISSIQEKNEDISMVDTSIGCDNNICLEGNQETIVHQMKDDAGNTATQLHSDLEMKNPSDELSNTGMNLEITSHQMAVDTENDITILNRHDDGDTTNLDVVKS